MAGLPSYTYLLAALFILAPTISAVCPDSCECSTTSDGLQHAKCSNLIEVYKSTLRQKHNYINDLNLSHADITKVHHELDRFTEMVTLDLSHNGLTALNKFLQNAKKLVHLNLAHNRLHKAPLTNLPVSVSSLDLTGNLLKDVPADLGHLPNLKKILLDGNPLDCSCNNIHSRNRLISSNVNIDDIKCQTPTHLKGRSWLELKTKDICKISKPDFMDMMMGDEPSDAETFGAINDLEKSKIILGTNTADDDDNVLLTYDGSSFSSKEGGGEDDDKKIEKPENNIDDSIEGSGEDPGYNVENLESKDEQKSIFITSTSIPSVLTTVSPIEISNPNLESKKGKLEISTVNSNLESEIKESLTESKYSEIELHTSTENIPVMPTNKDLSMNPDNNHFESTSVRPAINSELVTLNSDEFREHTEAILDATTTEINEFNYDLTPVDLHESLNNEIIKQDSENRIEANMDTTTSSTYESKLAELKTNESISESDVISDAKDNTNIKETTPMFEDFDYGHQTERNSKTITSSTYESSTELNNFEDFSEKNEMITSTKSNIESDIISDINNYADIAETTPMLEEYYSENQTESNSKPITFTTYELSTESDNFEDVSEKNEMITSTESNVESGILTETMPIFENFDTDYRTENNSEKTTTAIYNKNSEFNPLEDYDFKGDMTTEVTTAPNSIESDLSFNDNSSDYSETYKENTTPRPEISKISSYDFEDTTIINNDKSASKFDMSDLSNEYIESYSTTDTATAIIDASDELLEVKNIHQEEILAGSGEGSGFFDPDVGDHTNVPFTTTQKIQDFNPTPIVRILEDEGDSTEYPIPNPPSIYPGGPDWHRKTEPNVVTIAPVTPEATRDTTVSERIRVTQASEIMGQAPPSDENVVPHKTGTYVCIALIIVLLVGLIGFAITKGQMRKRRDRRLLRQQKRDVEKASKEMVDMNKSLLGKPAAVVNSTEKKINGKYELVPTHELHQKKGENGDVSNGIKHEVEEKRTDSPRDTNQNKSSSIDNNLSQQIQAPQQETSFDSEPGVASSRKDTNSLSSEDIFVPINDDNPVLNSNVDLNVSQPLINGDPIVDSDFLMPSREYVPVYSPDMGRVRIKMTETPKPKTPVLVTRSRSNAGDIIITPTLDENASKTTT